MEEPESVVGSAEEELINFNASDWYFSIPKSKATLFPETLLWKEAPAQGESDNRKLLIDQHSFVFRHLHFYTQTLRLPFLSSVEFIV